MSERGTESRNTRRGSALLGSLIVFIGLLGLVSASLALSTAEVRESRRTIDEVRAKYLADAALERGLFLLSDVVKKNSYDPMTGLDNFFAGADTITPFVGQPVNNGGAQVGAYSITMNVAGQTTTSYTVEIQATGYLPDAPANLAPGQENQSWEAVSATVQLDLAPSGVFDYAYFINNWGWFYGSTIFCNGNARSNGQFDAGGYSPTVSGQPLYGSVSWNGSVATLADYVDDNGDGLMDGNDGGVFSGWDIVNAQNVQGNGGLASNQHDFEDPVEMPNLADLSHYEAEAIAGGSSISIAGVPVTNGVFGDESGETGNLYLHGTPADPIVLDGPVVVQGDVIISGHVTGQGAIYAGGNVYVPDSIQYVDGPVTPRPTGNTQAETEAWLSANWDKDFLGLFAAENVVVGDHTHSTWRYYVSSWMGSSLNKSEEDAGEDGIPNTKNGKDGIPNTADDDVLEDDNVWSVELYTVEDLANGLIPPGFNVGDAIPGTGEDIDGDGQYDGGTSLADIDITTPLDTSNWGGNMPGAGISSYSDIASLYADHIDAVLYTNHSFCYLVLGSNTAKINGALVSRNENIIYGTPTIEMNHDARLLGGSTGMASSLLPKVMQSPQIVRWQRLDRDPNRYLGMAP